MKVIYRLEALGDLQEQHSYIEKENPIAAGTVIATIRKAVERLEIFPYSGRRGIVDGTYELVVPRLPYIVVYRILSEIEIIAVFHTSTDKPRA